MAKAKMDIKLKKCTTPKFRVSFPHVFEPNSFKGQKPKYSVTMLFDKSADMKELNRAIKNAMVEKFGKDKDEWPKYKRPFRNGSLEKPDLEGYKGKIFFTATCKTKPGLIDGMNENVPIESEEDFYAGCYAKATLIAFYYDDPKDGVSFALCNLKKVGDGKPFSGKRDAAEDFSDDVDDSESDDEDNYEDEIDEDDGGF